MNKIISKKFLIFVSIIFIIGLISGIIYYYSFDQGIKDNILNTMNSFTIDNINNILKHMVVLSIIIVSSTFIIGFPLSLFYLYYEGISVGFTCTIFTVMFGINGFLYSLIYLFVTKLIFIFLLFIFTKKSLNISKLIVNLICNKNNTSAKNSIIYNFKNLVFVTLIILINDVLIYIFSDNILNLFAFLIK